MIVDQCNKKSKNILSIAIFKNSNNFDLLRLMAAFAVIVGHAYPISPQPPLQDWVLSVLHFDYSGSLAVKFFFFLSGLLVTESIINRPEPMKFIARRLFRIYPSLLVCLLFTILIVGPIYTNGSLPDYFLQKSTWTYLTKNLGLFRLQWKLPTVLDDSEFGLNGALWTLNFEFVCYVYVAVFCAIGVFSRRIISNLIFLSVIVVAFFAPHYLPYFSRNPDAVLLPACFSIGVLFAVNKKNIILDIRLVALLWLLVMCLSENRAHIISFYLAFFYTSIYLGSLPFTVAHLKLPFDASYGVYLYGFLVQQCVHASLPNIGVHGNQIVSMIIALILGIFSWYLFEKPALKLAREFTEKDWSQNPAIMKIRSIGSSNVRIFKK